MTEDRNISWGAAILGAFAITFAIVIIFGIAPSTFIVTVNKSYGKIPNSRQSRFVRDLISQGYHVIIGGWLVVGAYQLQKMGSRTRRVIAGAVLLGLPCIAFGLFPAVAHGFINKWVHHFPPDQQAQALYDADLWAYSFIIWGGLIGLFALLTPGWIIGLKKIEERFAGTARERESAFGRPVVTT